MHSEPLPLIEPGPAGRAEERGWAAADLAAGGEYFFTWFAALQQTEPDFVWSGLFTPSPSLFQVAAQSERRDGLANSLLPLAEAASKENQLKLSVVQRAAGNMTAMALPLAGTAHICVAVLERKLAQASRFANLFELAAGKLATDLARTESRPRQPASNNPAGLTDADLIGLLAQPDADAFAEALFSRFSALLMPDQSMLARLDGERITVLRSSQVGDPLPPGSRAGQARTAAIRAAGRHDGTLLSSSGSMGDPALVAVAAEDGAQRVMAIILPGRLRDRLVWLAFWDASGADRDAQFTALAPRLDRLAEIVLAGRPAARNWLTESLPTWIDPRGWRSWLSLAAALLAVWLLLPAPFHVIGEARLRSTEQRALVAPRDGFLSAVHVRPGDIVRRGDVLAEFDTRELLLRQARIGAQIEQAASRRMNAMAAFKTAMVQVSNAEIDAMSAERDLISLLLDQSRLTAEEEGIVVSGDMLERVGTAVRHGEPMFQLAPLGGFIVAIDIPQKDITEAAIGQTGSLKLTALPFDSFPITLDRVSLSTEEESGMPGFVGLASIDAGHDAFRPGMQGVAHIEIGQATRAWVLLRDALFWAQMQWWRWVP